MKEVKEKLPTTSLPPPPTPRQSLKPLFLSVSVILLLLYSLSPSPPPPTSLSGYLSFLHPRPPHPSPESLILTLPSPTSAREASESFTKVTHIAGTDSDRLSALRVKDQWEGLLGLKRSGGGRVFESGSWESRRFLIGGGRGKGRGGWMRKLRKWVRWGKTEKARVWIDTYYPLLNSPLFHSLTLTPPNASTPSYVASLTEDVLPEDPTSGDLSAPTFHGFSKNGTASGQLVYAGTGSKEEFEALAQAGIEVSGKIVIVQYGGGFRGLKILRAQEVGAVGVIIYTDPIEDGEITKENGFEPYPDGPARQPSSVQRGSVQFLSIYPGDPLTPSLPAYKNATRIPLTSPDLNIPSIPSFPISYKDAVPLLVSLNGRGKRFEELGIKRPEGWREGGLGGEGVEYWTGPGEGVVEMVNEVEQSVKPIWNTMALIPGRIRDEIVVLGNHNDAWTFGAGDPISGTATVHEITKTLGVLLSQGWQPLRSILLASWDAEEYGLIGSTEFGEDFSTFLKENVVAYLNVDVGASGSNFGVGASPSLKDLFRDVAGLVEDPEFEVGRSMREKMKEDGERGGKEELLDLPRVGPLGSGSDYTVFLQYLGLASGNIGYSRKSTDPVYHYHSIYDSAYWMSKYGDPTFERHVAVSKVLGLALLRLSDSFILPINVTTYAYELASYVDKVKPLSVNLTATEQSLLNLSSLYTSISLIETATTSLDLEILSVQSSLYKLHHPLEFTRESLPCLHKLVKQAQSINKRLQSFESGFVTDEGLPERPWYKSRIVAPGRFLGYGATTLPALTEAFTLDGNLTFAVEEVGRLNKIFVNVARKLQK